MSRLRLLHKLRKMPPHEIRTRLAEKLRVRNERKLYSRADSPRSVAAAELIKNCLRLVPGARADELRHLHDESADTYAQLADAAGHRADAILGGQWEILGHAIDVTGIKDWSADPRTPYVFPKRFYADLSLYELGNGIDVKYVWELGRHQFLVELARGWRLGGRQHAAECARTLLLDWIAQNRQYEGVHWTSALELAMRGISWICTIATLAEWDGWKPEDWEVITRSLCEQAEYIEHHLSYYSSPYNHLVGEAAGLYLIGCAVAGTEHAERWRRLGHRVLREHGPRQFYDDGFCVEQATGYHFYTLGFMSLAIAAARQWGEPLSDLEQVVQRAFHAGLAFRQPNGRWPAIGDVDSARAVPVHHDDFWEFDSLCVLGSALFHDQQLLPPAHAFSEEAYWLLGNEAQAVGHLAEDTSEERPTAFVLPDSGYAIAGSDRDWVCFDAGPLGDGLHADATPSTAHGHADTLQILYQHDGEDFLIDPGMPFYFGDDDWVGHFRAPAAHNTLSVAGVEIAKRAGRLAWSHVAATPQLAVRLAHEAWLMRACAEWAAGTTVERNVLAIPGQGIWIADRIVTNQPRQVRWFWQLGTTGQEPQLWSDQPDVQTSLQDAENDAAVGWFAPGYGVHQQGQRFSCEVPPTDRVLVVTHFGNSALPVHVQVTDQAVSCLPVAAPSSEATFASNAQTAADVVWQIEIDGRLVTYSAGNIANGDTPLDGVGDWPVFKHAAALSSVS